MENVIIHYETGAKEFAHWLFGYQPAERNLAWLAGALSGAAVNVSVREKKGWLYLAVVDPAHFEIYETSIRRGAPDELFAYIHEVRVALVLRGQGLGAQAFLRQVKGARALGLKRFELFAAGDPADTSQNGYYTWARFGFNAPLRPLEQKALPPELRGVTDLNGVMQRGGQRWWFEKGSFRSMVFDLADGSEMMKVFQAYLQEKGITED